MIQVETYLNTLLDEKNISPDHIFIIKSDGLFGDHIVPMNVLIEFIDGLDITSQQKIKDTLVQIDFKNGDILHFLNYLTEGMVQLKFNN
jgi:hypothetical protein